jgi:hypothetical protein
MPFSLNNLDATVSQATHPEELRNILVLIFREVVMRATGTRTEQTGFEAATNEELELAFFRAANELLVRWGRLQDQLGNVVVSIHNHIYFSTNSIFSRIFNASPEMARCQGHTISIKNLAL